VVEQQFVVGGCREYVNLVVVGEVVWFDDVGEVVLVAVDLGIG